MPMPLEGIKVLDFTIWQHGAYGATMLADLGADVVKVEEPQSGDHARWYISQSPDGFNSYFQAHNRGKKSLGINLKHPQGREIIYRLATKVDVVTENYARGVMDKLGIGYQDLAPLNPRLIYASATAFGSRGPIADWRGMDSVFQAMGGVMVNQGGGPGNPPQAVATPIGDQVGGMIFAQAVITALLVRERTGLGQYVETSGLASQIALQSWRTLAALRHGGIDRRQAPPGRFGTNPTWHFYQDSEGKWFVLGLMAHQGWPAFCQAIERPEWIEDERFASLKSRLGNQELEDLLSQTFATKPRTYWLERLQAVEVPCGPIYSYGEVVEDPQVLANEYVMTVDDPHWGELRVPGVPWLFEKTPTRPQRGAPELAEHTEVVLTELGGYSWDDVARFREEKVI